ncbi:MAG: hypothetical protein P4L96_06140, partial [Rhodoferax sp.]|nr:hypothetical protein [Rhodoferax sp.]
MTSPAAPTLCSVIRIFGVATATQTKAKLSTVRSIDQPPMEPTEMMMNMPDLIRLRNGEKVQNTF